MTAVVRKAVLLASLVAALAAAGPVHAFGTPTWTSRVDAARAYAEQRSGVVAFAVVDQRGRLHGYHRAATAPSASVLKAMLLVAYLRKQSVRHRALADSERGLLGPMIRRSDNAAASTVLGLVGRSGLTRLAAVTGMRRFRVVLPHWGISTITPRDQACFFYRIDSYVPARHRRYAMSLLAGIVPWQRWGVARVAPAGWELYFKGGWSTGTGLVDHQVALLTLGKTRISVAITTRFNPDHAYGKQTLRGVAARLFAGL
jgi:beta-lactamase family protein